MSQRTIIIGDLQGMYDETISLLNKCNVTPHDRVIFTGDLVDRGPDNDKCIDLAIKYEQLQGSPASVLGNHEEKHLHYRNKEERGKDPNVQVQSHIRTRMQLKAHHYAYMRTMPLYIRLHEYNAVVVHAGVFPGRTIEEQDPHHLLHIQMINPKEGTKTMWPSKAPHDWKFWTHFWDGPERIIFGHSVLDRPLITDKVYGIDGGACFGRNLYALILPTWEVVSVSSNKDHGHGQRGRSSENIALVNVHGDVNTFS